jgi:DNA-binding CsgD family transcriptional regulator
MPRGQRDGSRIARLTSAESRVLERLMLGETNKEIAAELGCSPRTVEFHLAHIFNKTGVEGRGRLMSGVVTGRIKTDPPPALTMRTDPPMENDRPTGNDLAATASIAARSKRPTAPFARKSRA